MDRRRSQSLLLACGIAMSLFYVGVDLLASSRWPAYRYADYTVSELSAIGAPTRALWVGAMLFGYTPLLIAFASGVWRASEGRRALRITALLLFCGVAIGTTWPPMHLRGTPTTLTDTLHIVWTAVNGVVTMVAMGFAAAALGRRFRVFTIATIVAMLVGGAWTSTLAPGVAAGVATPSIGLVERINVYGSMLWFAVLAAALLHEHWSTLAVPRARARADQYRNSAVSPMSRSLTQRSR